MNDLAPCRACSCHVKTSDETCPFCGAPHEPLPSSRRGVPRMSRARWLAFGSTIALLGCGGNVEPGKSLGSAQGAATDAGEADGNDNAPTGVACASRSGFFECGGAGGTVCDRSIQ